MSDAKPEAEAEVKASVNYLVTCLCFGSYPRGSVIPGYALLEAGNLKHLIEIGAVQETTDPVNVQILPRTTGDDTASTTATATMMENNQLRNDIVRLEAAHADAKARHEAEQHKAEAYKNELATKVTQVDQIRRLHEQEKSRADKNEQAAVSAKKAADDLAHDNAKLRKEVAEWKELADKASKPAPAHTEKPNENSTSKVQP